VAVDGHGNGARRSIGLNDLGRQQPEVTITLTDAQIRQVTRAATKGSRGLATLLAHQTDLRAAAQAVGSSAELRGISRSALRAMLVLCAFPTDGSYRTLAEVTQLVGLSPSTAHRYVTTWVVVGVLEQEAVTRRYRVCTGGVGGVSGGEG
jgi:hypothetical protein